MSEKPKDYNVFRKLAVERCERLLGFLRNESPLPIIAGQAASLEAALEMVCGEWLGRARIDRNKRLTRLANGLCISCGDILSASDCEGVLCETCRVKIDQETTKQKEQGA